MRYVLLICFLILSVPSHAFLGFGTDCDSAQDCQRKGDRAFDQTNGNSCKTAIDYYERACDKYDSGKGCYDAATCYSFDPSIGNKSKAKKYYKKACQNRYSPACVYYKM